MCFHRCAATRRRYLRVFLSGLTAILVLSCSSGEQSTDHSRSQTDGITFFDVGANTVFSNALRDRLRKNLGPDAIAYRNTIDLEFNTKGFLQRQFPILHDLNQRLNTPAGERVEHDTVKLMYRYAVKENLPFSYVELVFSNNSGKPLLIHAGWGSHGDYDVLLQKVPDLKLLLAHAGFPLYSETWNNIKIYKNVYIDLSQTSYLNDRMTREVVDYLGVEKCLFGTDGPYGVHGDDGLFDYSFIKRRIERLFPDKEIQKKLLGENFLELIQI